eukprot:m.333317 g.333317  ORF g.333317 m.333317 type:complete len:619 (+) comp17117_c0_seq1:128-1984(+)
MSDAPTRVQALGSSAGSIASEVTEMKARVQKVYSRLDALEKIINESKAKGPAAAKPSAPSSGAQFKSSSDDGGSMEHPFTMHNRVVVKKLLARGDKCVGETVTVGGWVRTGRLQEKGALAFLEVNDGSCLESVQCVITKDVYDLTKLTPTGTSVVLKGSVVKAPEKAKQDIEVAVESIIFVGLCDAQTYPIPKGRLKLENLRNLTYLRCRTRIIQAMFRVRNALASATHQFFQQNGFLYLHSPIITASDCEGAGEMFQVTTLLQNAEQRMGTPKPTADEVAKAQAAVDAKAAEIEKLQADSDKKIRKKAKGETAKLGELQRKLEQLQDDFSAVGGISHTEAGKIDYKKDFFSKPTFLTVSGQLDAEVYACSMTSIYTFGPTFRAEDSHTTRHLAEFWMIEPEIAFCDLEANMKCAEAYVQFCAKFVLEHCHDDMEFFTQFVDKEALTRLEQIATKPFVRLSYTEACEVLQQHVADGKKKFEEEVTWGIDLGSEHERYLAEEVYKGPIIVYNYPASIKAFYMRLNDDGKTVAAMDVLVPTVGELIGGSQREERVDVLEQKIKENDLDIEAYDWYLALRRYGGVPHSGFGLGFERLVLFVTGLENIRDVIPFPRFPGRVL